MKMKRSMAWPAIAGIVTLASVPLAHGALMHPVTDWVVHNTPGSPTISDAETNSPTFGVDGNDDNTTVMGVFPKLQLVNDGDYVKLTTTLTMTGRTNNLAAAGLNTQLRIGLFDGPDGAVVFEDVPNLGLFMVYANVNQAANRQVRALTDTSQVNPFISSNDIVQGTDTGNSIQGANPGPVDFELTLTRNGGLLDIAGQISGTDSSTGDPYLATYAFAGYDPADIGGFSFNRVGFFFGPQVNAPSALLANVTIETNIPEPSSCTLAALAAIAGLTTIGRRVRLAAPALGAAR